MTRTLILCSLDVLIAVIDARLHQSKPHRLHGIQDHGVGVEAATTIDPISVFA